MRVYIHGNCQAPAIAMLLREACPHWKVTSYEVFSQKILDEMETYYEDVKQADIIISQPIHDGYRSREDLSSSWIRAHAKPGIPIIVFPSMFFDGQLVGWRSVSIPGYGMPYQDMLVLHCAAIGMSVARIISIISDEETYPEKFIEQEIELSIAEMKRREAMDGIDIALSPFLEEHGRRTRLFHVINHPYRQALAHVANSALDRLGYAVRVSFQGADCIPFPHVPLPASVQRYLRKHASGGTPWEIGDPLRFHLPTERLTRGEYLIRVVDHLRSFPREDLISRLREPHVLPFLRRLSEAAPAIPRIEIWREAV